jgi:hypothetical protein
VDRLLREAIAKRKGYRPVGGKAKA